MSGGFQKCLQCNISLPYSCFGKDTRGLNGLKRQCQICKKKDSKKYRKEKRKNCDSRYMANIIIGNMRRKHKSLGVKYPPEFSQEEIINIIDSGKCQVTNRGFESKNITKYRINPFMASPDRINNRVGYRKNNVRWVMSWVNIARQAYDIDFFEKLLKGVR